MALIGPIRNIWEVEMIGEGYLRVCKPEISGGVRKGWQLPFLKRLGDIRSMNLVTRECYDGTDNSGDNDW